MIFTRQFFSALVLSFLLTNCTTQKFNEDGYSVTFNSFDTKQASYFSKKQNYYFGEVLVTHKNGEENTYQFFLQKTSDNYILLKIRNLEGEPLFPTLDIDEEVKKFSYKNSQGERVYYDIVKNKTPEEIAHSGVLTWLKTKNL